MVDEDVPGVPGVHPYYTHEQIMAVFANMQAFNQTLDGENAALVAHNSRVQREYELLNDRFEALQEHTRFKYMCWRCTLGFLLTTLLAGVVLNLGVIVVC